MKRRYHGLLTGLALFLSACSNSDELKITSGVTTTFDGNLVAYDVRGEGETALVFIHCMGCNRSFWKDQLNIFAQDYKVISLDLPGHGLSNSTRSTWSVSDLGHDVAAVVKTLGLRRVIFVGHSIGAPVALAAAANLKGAIKGVVCVDALHDLSRVLQAKDLSPVLSALKEDFQGAMAAHTENTLRPDTDPKIKSFILEQANKANKDVVIGLIQSFAGLDQGALMRKANVPIRCINAKATPPYAQTTNITGNQAFGDFDAVFMENTGHFLHLEQPGTFNTQLNSLLTQININGPIT